MLKLGSGLNRDSWDLGISRIGERAMNRTTTNRGTRLGMQIAFGRVRRKTSPAGMGESGFNGEPAGRAYCFFVPISKILRYKE